MDVIASKTMVSIFSYFRWVEVLMHLHKKVLPKASGQRLNLKEVWDL